MLTDSLELYGSRLRELEEERGKYGEMAASRDFELIRNTGIDYMLELSHYDRKRIHNLKYYTWVEQQGKSAEELDAQWYDHRRYWDSIHSMGPKIDQLIEKFNDLVEKS